MIVSGTETLSNGKRYLDVNYDVDVRAYFQEQKKYLVWKRVFDVVFSLLVIVFLLSWLIPIIAVLIKLNSKGPVFFVQKRVGFLGRSFSCYKFRTMVLNKEANLKQAVENDPRITKVGAVLRVSNLDELPQFFNVLKGEMSIVGPRPHMHKDCQDFSKVVPHYKFRSLLKPGITGLAQVKGYRGPAKDFESIFRRYEWDSFYVRNISPGLDARIMKLTAASTLSALFSRFFIAKRKEPAVVLQLKSTEYLN